MNSFEVQLRRCSLSWRTLLGAPLVTLLIFLAMASGTVVMDRKKVEQPLPLRFTYVPPQPVPLQKTAPPLSGGFAESFKFDPTRITSAPDVPLELLSINLNPQVEAGLAVELDLQRSFEVEKPSGEMSFTIFERNQVDEIPVWLHGPMPRVPNELRTEDGESLVLYVVTDRGRTNSVYVLDSSDQRFVPGIKSAINDWRFRPARKAGKPVSVWVQHTVRYRPSSKSPFSL